MKKIYWRPRAVSRMALLSIAVLSIAGWLFVEYRYHHYPVKLSQTNKRFEAARLAAECMHAVKHERLQLGHPIDPAVDPTEMGLIGVAMSSATSVLGVLEAKQTTINPNFAAIIYDMLRQAGVQPDDYVAVGYSGSFPALNICVAAAIQTLGAKPVSISSAAASQWGANIPDLLWLDMERTLVDRGLLSARSVRATIGGVEDRGLGMDARTRETLQEGIARSGISELKAADTFKKSVDQRMQIYKQGAGEDRIQAYVNVGGGTTSVGKSLGKRLLHAGLNTRLSYAAGKIDSVMTRFLNEGVPVIHLIRIRDLATHYGLEIAPRQFPDEGTGAAFTRYQYSRPLTAGVLAAILISLYIFIRSDLGFRIFQSAGRSRDEGHPEPMI